MKLETRKFIKKQIKEIREQVGNDKVICALSGGVDSAVTAALVHKAIGKQLTCVFVDTGLMRKDEGKQVQANFKKAFPSINFKYIDAHTIFFNNLKGITDPEAKRKCIGRTFIEVFKQSAQSIKGLKFLAQGTIYPDIVESKTKAGNVIKSHHNVGGLPKDLNLGLVEPLKSLYKPQVRLVGRRLGLPKQMLARQPFPGPGLGVRVIGELTPSKVKLLQEADAIVRDEIDKSSHRKHLWQYFAVLPNVKSTGVKAGQRLYGHLIVIRAVQSKDAMSAKFAQLPYTMLAKISKRITDEVIGINRVAYDITSKPPGTIEWE
ncbi:MAG: glutamine-hydrolyzing GMP synthase [Mycoplasma sp.]|nr:glutamine-hydrolyzing GMP synthase [Candidatus Hennigella equi]